MKILTFRQEIVNPIFSLILELCGGESMEKVRICVNLEKGLPTIQTVRTVGLFDNPAEMFMIKSDSGGFSAIEKRRNGYHAVNHLRERQQEDIFTALRRS